MAKNTQLINTVQKALQDLIDEGAYQKIIAKYGLHPGGVGAGQPGQQADAHVEPDPVIADAA